MNAFYPKGRQRFATGLVDWEGDTIKGAVLVAGYTYDDADEFFDDVPGGAVLFEFTLAGCSATDGILDATDHVESGLGTGDEAVGLVVFKDTGADATSPLLFFFDRAASGALLSRETAGGDFRVRWPNGPTKIVRI